LNEWISESTVPKYHVTCYRRPFVILSVQGDERVKCLEIVGNTVTLNVTAPVYNGVSLVLRSDKEKYTVDEVVHFSLFIENSSDKPFVFTEDEPIIKIRSDNGTEVFDISYIADII